MGSIWIGCLAAVAYGSADFVARFTSQALGVTRALFGSLLAGVLAFSAYLLLSGKGFPNFGPSFILLPIAGALNAFMLGALYAALARGPVAIAAPLVGSYPALIALLLLPLGIWPAPLQWLGIALTCAGGIALGAGSPTPSATDAPRPSHGITIAWAMASAVGIAIQSIILQEAAQEFGAIRATWGSRFFALLAVSIFVLARREGVRIPFAWAPAVIAQGLLDGGALLLLALGNEGTDRAVVSTLASGFSAVTVILARVFLNERIALSQWASIGVILSGVATLATA
jgi:drug/metabolite transporter (DMT)-like permease